MTTDAEQSHRSFHSKLITHWIKELLKQPPLNTMPKRDNDNTTENHITLTDNIIDQSDSRFIEKVYQLQELPGGSKEQALGQWVITTCITHYPNWVPMIPRDLFWYFGGDCMHFLGDEEISQFQQIDERYAEETTNSNYEVLRNQVLGLH